MSLGRCIRRASSRRGSTGSLLRKGYLGSVVVCRLEVEMASRMVYLYGRVR